MIAIVRAWWADLLRGFAALAIAPLVLVQAHIPLTMVALLLGSYVLVDSVVAVCGAEGRRHEYARWRAADAGPHGHHCDIGHLVNVSLG